MWRGGGGRIKGVGPGLVLRPWWYMVGREFVQILLIAQNSRHDSNCRCQLPKWYVPNPLWQTPKPHVCRWEFPHISRFHRVPAPHETVPSIPKRALWIRRMSHGLCRSSRSVVDSLRWHQAKKAGIHVVDRPCECGWVGGEGELLYFDVF